MDLRQLRYFVCVARLRSFTKAARMLNVAQPSLSRQIRCLEEEFGVLLLDRDTHGVRPTEAGLRLLEMGDYLLRHAEQLRNVVRSPVTEPAGDVVIGLLPSIAYLVAPNLVARMRKDYPRIRLRIVEAIGAFLLDWLLLGRIDIAVVTKSQQARGIIETSVSEQEMVLVGRAADLVGLPDPVPLSAISKVPLLVTHGFRVVIEPFAQAAGQHLTFDMELDSLPIIKGMIANGTGMSILPYGSIHEERMEGRMDIRRVADSSLKLRLSLAKTEIKPPYGAASVVEQLLMEEIRRVPMSPGSIPSEILSPRSLPHSLKA